MPFKTIFAASRARVHLCTVSNLYPEPIHCISHMGITIAAERGAEYCAMPGWQQGYLVNGMTGARGARYVWMAPLSVSL